MFELLQTGDQRNFGGRIRALLVSALIHVFMISAAVVLPLVFFQVMPGFDLIYLMAAPPPPAVHDAPPPRTGKPGAVPKPVILEKGFTMPRVIPQGVAELPAPDDFVGIADVPGGIGSGSLISGLGPAAIPGGRLAIDASPPERLSPPKRPNTVPVVIGGVVQEAKLIRRVLPEYSTLMRSARAEGRVVMEVAIDEEGNVSSVRVIQGHALLDAEAVRAVHQWKYSPTLLNGEPVPVISTVTVIFKLGR